MKQSIIPGFNLKQPPGVPVIKTVDLHTAGEPLRVITGGLPEIKGGTILEKRRYFKAHYDAIRTGLMWEPRGHADMYGAVITESVTDDGHFGVFFLHNEGYSTMCGHAMIALTTLVAETGWPVEMPADGILRIDGPPGRIKAGVVVENNRVEKAFFRNVPSYVLLTDQAVEVSGIGKVCFDIAYGGAFYAIVDAGSIGAGLEKQDYSRLIDWGRKIKHAISGQFEIRHPKEDDLSFLYGTIFTGPAKDPAHHSRNVCVFADGEVDRSPTGSGLSARAAVHALKDGLIKGKTLVIESVIDTTMEVTIIEQASYFGYPAVIPEVAGRASITGQNRFIFQPDDKLKNGFFIR